MKIEPVRGWMACGSIRALAENPDRGPMRVHGKRYGASDNCTEVLIVPLDSIKKMREQVCNAIVANQDAGSLTQDILAAIGITEEE